MNTHDTSTHCPFCNYFADAISAADSYPGKPEDGDLSLCIKCGEWAMIDSTQANGLRRPTDDEYAELAAMPETRAVRAAWLKTVKGKL